MIYGLMLGMLVIFLGLALAPAVKEFTDSARAAPSGDTLGLDCNNDSISSFDKGTCVAVDLSGFYLIGSLIFIGGLVVSSRIIFQ